MFTNLITILLMNAGFFNNSSSSSYSEVDGVVANMAVAVTAQDSVLTDPLL